VQVTDTSINYEAQNLNDKDFLYQKYTVEGANLAYIADLAGVSKTTMKDMIRDRGLKRSQDLPVLRGQVPYGWKIRKGRLVEHKGEQEVISAMNQHRTDGKSLREICRILDASGIKPKRGNSWQAASVMKILKMTAQHECDNKNG
jgi:hypothetical protein